MTAARKLEAVETDTGRARRLWAAIIGSYDIAALLTGAACVLAAITLLAGPLWALLLAGVALIVLALVVS